MPHNTHQHSQQRRYYIDVFPDDLEEAAEMLAERQFSPYKEISEKKRVRILVVIVGKNMVIINSIIKWQVKNYAKGCTRAMLSSVLAFKEHCKGQPMTYAFLARKALSTRPNWKQINETEFIFTKTNNSITITEEMSLKNVIDLVVAEELIDSLSNMSESEYDNLLQIALEEVNKTLNIKR